MSVLFNKDSKLHKEAKTNLERGYYGFFSSNNVGSIIVDDKSIEAVQKICGGSAEKLDPTTISLKA